MKNRLRLGVAKVSMMLFTSLLVASPVGAAPENTIVDIKIKPPVISAPQPKIDLSSDQNFSMIADSYVFR